MCLVTLANVAKLCSQENARWLKHVVVVDVDVDVDC